MAGTWDMLGTGGPVIVILALMSLLSLTVIAVKLIQLWPVRSGGQAREQALTQWKDGDRKQAQDSIAGGKSPADRVMTYAMQALQEGLRGPLLQDELQRRGNEEVSRMNSLIRLLELIAMVSPLLGLLGTVLGMIQSFQELELAQGAANASVLAGGIWQALLTTAAGLLVAIPAAIAAGLFAARIDAAAQAIESAAGRLLLIDGSR
ncbi:MULTISPECIES: MotA/TolQ/ExbB proton channel family protein [unclassified Leisingera]|jgi:biopolymer transport protein ExbB|uniref:MotA/TolQ/ExbB proton channel family protein n=1 Tax=unclassified Leisingera TaxID=2614906 RepID=UPI0002E49257|nr:MULTISPECIES: MotA/TolQ/ExbB proton channel family protein [unclassified Leisingera]KIC23723.1 flagellar motor protein MotA [Leisingera sp. ANG-S3]KIC24029.1 flagellar motor protein MotA [Leisingera sp. ANG-M6]KIC51583.1 flagellar motor protein MotA [Leisingera sp. ANG-S]KID07640.1 flagellar motor protein MotA [Leisingera sp. ANG1]